MSKEAIKYYKVDTLMDYNTTIAMSIGKRSAGKTYSSLYWGIKNIVVASGYKKKIVYMRRFAEDIRGFGGEQLFKALENNGEISKLTNGKFDGVKYYARKWYFTKTKKTKTGSIVVEKDKEPFAFAYGINTFESDKGGSDPNIELIILDEFVTRQRYLTGEVEKFFNAISTLVRERTTVRIIMLANSVSWESPYFHSMGIYDKVKEMTPGSFATFTFESKELGVEDTTVAIEFTENLGGKESNKYFNFNTKTSDMIRFGAWETDNYPIIDPEEKRSLRPRNITFRFYIQVYHDIFEGNIILNGNKYYLYIFKPDKKVILEELSNKTLIFSTEYNPNFNYRRDILHPIDEVTKKISAFFKADMCYYDSNKTGEMISNYLNLF